MRDRGSPRFEEAAVIFEGRSAAAPRLAAEGLWVTGSLAPLRARTVAVVGTRAPSEGGRERAYALGLALGRAGVTVVSGLALGIDGAAHAGALAGNGLTVGVLGGGHHHFFPRRNRALADAMVAAGGAVLSPYAPHEPARPWQFLQRNGVVAALADAAVVVVEAAARSGALNTAMWAGNLGIDVLAYPGDVDRPKAAGCNALIRDGATLVRDPDDVLEAIGCARLATGAGSDPQPRLDFARRSPLERRLLEALAREPRDLDALLAAGDDPVADVCAALMTLEIEGVVKRDPGFPSYALA